MSVLSQTYSPLEIIISDDCSRDRTYEIIEEVVKGYSGPHQVVLNRNATNLGLIPHVCRVNHLAKGELIVAAAGDDVSLPERVGRFVEEWVKADRPSMIGCDSIVVDSMGVSKRHRKSHRGEVPSSVEERVRLFMHDGTFGVLGATEAWTKEMFDSFPPIRDGVCEDRIIALRALLTGGILFIPEPLVRYREHEENFWGRVEVTNSMQESREKFRLLMEAENLAQHSEDLRFAATKGIISEELAGLLISRSERDQLLLHYCAKVSKPEIQYAIERLNETAARLAQKNQWVGLVKRRLKATFAGLQGQP